MGGSNGAGSGDLIAPLPVLMIIGGFFAMTLYNFVEIMFAIFSTFRVYRGMYFWSMLISTAALPFYVLGFILKFFSISNNEALTFVIILVSWVCVVTGQSLVVWSRLGLVVRDKRKIRWLLVMIVCDAFVFHIPTAVFYYLANLPQPKPKWIQTYLNYEKVEVTGFSVQETIIAAVYIYYAWQMLRPMLGTTHRSRPKRLFFHLVAVNILVVLMDVTLLGTQYGDQYDIQTPYKGFLYSVKLKLEFYVLNQLFSFLHGSSHISTNRIHERPSFVTNPNRTINNDNFNQGSTIATVIKARDEPYDVPLHDMAPHDRIVCKQDIDVEIEQSRAANGGGGSGPVRNGGDGTKDDAASNATSSSTINFAHRGA